MRLAVSQRVDLWPDRGERRDALDQRLARWLSSAGYIPIPTPNALGDMPLGGWLREVSPHGIVLSGGNDVGAAPERDRTELGLLEFAALKALPVLGICRGAQMMAVAAGGALHRVEGHVRSRHVLTSYGRGPWPAHVNSFHELGLAECPPGYFVGARSADGEIEAIVHDDLRWEGWMWHPEREPQFAADDVVRLTALFRSGH